MKALVLISLFVVVFSISSLAQKDTTATIDLLGEMNQASPAKESLLPGKIMFTQRIFWGEKGLMRSFNAFELTPEKRQKELKLRRNMLVAHQIVGFATLGGMVAQGIVGAQLYKGKDVKPLHEGLATAIEIGYFSTAGLSLFAPPKMLNERKGYSSIKLHKILAMVHFSGMITTMVLAGQLESNYNLKPWHRAAAYTTFGAFAASMIVIKF
jgi:hypothetical protein